MSAIGAYGGFHHIYGIAASHPVVSQLQQQTGVQTSARVAARSGETVDARRARIQRQSLFSQDLLALTASAAQQDVLVGTAQETQNVVADFQYFPAVQNVPVATGAANISTNIGLHIQELQNNREGLLATPTDVALHTGAVAANPETDRRHIGAAHAHPDAQPEHVNQGHAHNAESTKDATVHHAYGNPAVHHAQNQLEHKVVHAYNDGEETNREVNVHHFLDETA